MLSLLLLLNLDAITNKVNHLSTKLGVDCWWL